MQFDDNNWMIGWSTTALRVLECDLINTHILLLLNEKVHKVDSESVT